MRRYGNKDHIGLVLPSRYENVESQLVLGFESYKQIEDLLKPLRVVEPSLAQSAPLNSIKKPAHTAPLNAVQKCFRHDTPSINCYHCSGTNTLCTGCGQKGHSANYSQCPRRKKTTKRKDDDGKEPAHSVTTTGNHQALIDSGAA